MIKYANGEFSAHRIMNVFEENSYFEDNFDKNIAHARMGSEIKFDQNIFDNYCFDGWRSIHHDLLVLSAAIESADRRWARSVRRWSRRLHVRLPVIELTIWQDRNIQQQLVDALRHLTGDQWSFDFYQWEGEATQNDRQRPLFLNQNKQFALAYSEGLDSRCVMGLLDENDSAVCVRVAKYKVLPKDGERPFDRLPFEVCVDPSAEDSVRSRGFKFAVITAIAAHLSSVRRIVVPESGQGALGTVLCPLLGVYPDYRNHPTFFRRMEKFINAVLGTGLFYDQPRIWYTKGETISAYFSKGAQLSHILSTRSCWQQRHNVRIGGQVRQCGICAACLLRRMSIHAANIEDSCDAYAISDLKSPTFSGTIAQYESFQPTGTLFEFGYMGARHFQQLAELSNASDLILRPYVIELAGALGSSEADIHESLRRLLNQHSSEWHAFTTAAGEQSFLNTWTMGGRNG